MQNYLEYKGYIGTITLSPEDRCFFGTIFGINDLVTFEAETFDGIESAFHEAVDDYLETCDMLGRSPEKAFKGQFNVRITPELHKQLAYSAVKDGCSLNQYIEKTLEAHLEHKGAGVVPDKVLLDWIVL